MLSFITVVYGRELGLLELQARSFSQFVPASLVQEIVVILNDLNLDKLRKKVELIRSAYGPHADKLRILDPDELLKHKRKIGLSARVKLISPWLLGRRPRAGGWRGHKGWLTQQALKLSAARFVCANYSVILDAKNIWLAPMEITDFVANDGRAFANYFMGYAGKNQQAWFPPSLAAVGMPEDTPIDRTTSFLTPFVVPTEILLGCIYEIEKVRGSVAAAFLLYKPNPTEFFTINAYILKSYGHFDAIFSEGLEPGIVLSAKTSEESFNQILDAIDARESKHLALHSGAWRRFDQAQNDRLLKALNRHGTPLSRKRFGEMWAGTFL